MVLLSWSGRIPSIRACQLMCIAALALLHQVAILHAADDKPDPLILEDRTGGKVHAMSLQGYGGQEDWSSLTVMADGRVLIGLSSREQSAALLLIDPDARHVQTVMHLDEVGHLDSQERQPKIHVSPVADRNGVYHFVSHYGQDKHLPLFASRLGYGGMRYWRFFPPPPEVRRDSETQIQPLRSHSRVAEIPDSCGEMRGRVLPNQGEGAVALAGSADGRILYVVTFPSAHLLHFDTGSEQVIDCGRTNAVYAPRQIVMSPSSAPAPGSKIASESGSGDGGHPYVLDHQGQFWFVRDPRRGLEPTGVYLPFDPNLPGDLVAQGLVSTVANVDRSHWYAMTAWGQLVAIRFGSAHLQVTDLGYPADHLVPESVAGDGSAHHTITAAAMAQGADGWLYLGLSGYNRAADPSGDCWLIRFNPQTAQRQILARLDGAFVNYLCGSGGTDPRTGRVYFAASHLTGDHPYLMMVETAP